MQLLLPPLVDEKDCHHLRFYCLAMDAMDYGLTSTDKILMSQHLNLVHRERRSDQDERRFRFFLAGLLLLLLLLRFSRKAKEGVYSLVLRFFSSFVWSFVDALLVCAYPSFFLGQHASVFFSSFDTTGGAG